ncbi:hypothetical protein ABFS82_06G185000 [Erythranthe guttata]|uniref:S-protein homolog n=1 Tax=Erythranthe guttata TaxID=4155 RepID=A0A022RL73_ERYGU|nr:hypothetical protein MIMGU_mgv1a026260mg [Erythranthe guttata]
MKNIITCLILSVNIFITIASACFLTNEYEVHVVNKLPSPKLKLHCASKETDFGISDYGPNYDFHWKFCENVVSTTLYFCHLWWRNKQVSFNAFESRKTVCRNNCYYEARSDGIYFSGDGPKSNLMKKVYDWQNR